MDDKHAGEKLVVTKAQRQIIYDRVLDIPVFLGPEAIVDATISMMLDQWFHREYRIRWPYDDMRQPIYGYSVENGQTMDLDLAALERVLVDAREQGILGVIEGRTVASTEWRPMP